MDRREALSRVAFLFGGTIVGAEAFLSGCARHNRSSLTGMYFDEEHVSLLNEIAETILPATEASPGAKAADVGTFINTIVTDCYKTDEQKAIGDGLVQLNEHAKRHFQDTFVDLEAAQRHDLLVILDKEANDFVKGEDNHPHYFTMIKQLTLWGYFTSETGSRQALRYNPVPGRYEGCIPYAKGDKAWAAI